MAKLGQDLQVGRKKRRMSVTDFAARIGVSKGTLIRLEAGDPTVRIGTLAMALLALGELDRLGNLIDAARDDTGLLIDRSNLPQRIRKPRLVSDAEDAVDENDANPNGLSF